MEVPANSNEPVVTVRHLLVIAVDIVNDFMDTEKGVFHIRYKADGKPVAELLSELTNLGETLSLQGAELHQVGSTYTPMQFRTKGLERLCVDEWGRTPALDLVRFPLLLLKHGNGIFSTTDTLQLEKLRASLAKASHVLVVGCTTCSCIRVTVEQLLAEPAAAHLCVLIAENAVAGRASQLSRQVQLFTQWRTAHPPTRLQVISSWKQIQIQKPSIP